LEILNELDINFKQFLKQIIINRIEALKDQSNSLQCGLNIHLFIFFVLKYDLPDTDHFYNCIDDFH
jgi:hypothetical protein